MDLSFSNSNVPMVCNFIIFGDRIVTIWIAVDWFPLASVAEYVTIVWPNGNVVGTSLVIDAIPKMSIVVPSKIVVRSPVASAITSGGVKITGGVVL